MRKGEEVASSEEQVWLTGGGTGAGGFEDQFQRKRRRGNNSLWWIVKGVCKGDGKKGGERGEDQNSVLERLGRKGKVASRPYRGGFAGQREILFQLSKRKTFSCR